MARTLDDIRRITGRSTPNGRGGKGEKETSLPSSNGRTIDDIRQITGRNIPAESAPVSNAYDDYAQMATRAVTPTEPTYRYNSYADYENAINAVKPTGMDNLKYRAKGVHNRMAEINNALSWIPSFTPNWREDYNQYKEYTDKEKEYADLTEEFEMYKQDRGNVFREYNSKYGGNADFAEKSQTLPFAIQGFANMDRLYQDQAKMAGNADTTNRIAAYNNMSDDEKALANYLANTDLNAFWKYMSDMNAIEDREIYEQGMQKKQAAVESLDDPFSKAGMNALYTIEGSANKMSSAPAIPIEYAINKATGARQNPYGGYSGVSNMGASEQEYVAEQIRDATGNDVLPFLYNTGVSIGESWVGANAFGKTYSVLMGTTAFNNSYKELAERGASEEEIMTGAFLSGAAETLFEYVSLDKLLKAKDITSASKLIKETLKQAGVEGSEEFFTEVSNIITDELSMGANSEINRMIEEMRGNGDSEEEIKQTIADYIGKRITEATLGGMLSGGVMSGSFGGIDYGINKSIGHTTDVDELVDVIQGFDIDSDVRQKYEGDIRRNNREVSSDEFSNKVTEDMRTKFRNMTDAEIGQAVRDAYQEASKPNRNKYRNALINEFLQYESITPEEAEEYADAVVVEKPNAIQNMILNNPVVTEVKDKVNRGIGLQMYEETNRQLARIEKLSSAKVGLKELSNEGFKITNRTTVNDNDAIIKDVIKGDNDTIRIVTNKGESNHTQMTFTFNDAHLVKVAQGIENQFKRQSFLSNYDHKQNVGDYYDGFALAYKYGNESRGEDALINDVVNEGLLTLEQASNIYAQGEGEKTKASDEVREAQKNLLKGFRGFRRGHIKSKGINFKKLNATQRAVHSYAKIVAALGANVVLFNDSSADSKNGWYANGTIYLNLSARYYKSEGFDTTFSINTMAHELTHFLEDMSNENNDGTFEALKSAIFEYLGEENIEELKDKEKTRWAEDWQETYDSLTTKEDKELFAEETPKDMTDHEAESEVIARACEDMLSDATTLEQIMMGVENLKKKDLLLKRIKQFIDRLGNFLKKILDNKSPSEAAELMRKDAQRFEEVRQLWIKSFTSAANFIQKAKEEEAARIKAEKEAQATEVTEPTSVEEVVEETPEEPKAAEETEEVKEETEEVKEETPAETPKETKGQFANFKAFLASQGIDPNKTEEEFIAEVKARKKKKKKNSSKVDLKVDSDGNKLSEGQIEYFSDSKALDENGELQKVYHGTIREFYEFDREFANMEGDWGKGFYFTTSEEDVEENYANENGADLTNKIESEADRLEGWDEYEDMSHDEIVKALREKYITSEPITLECYLNITNPCYPTTYLFADLVPDILEDDYETEDEYYDAVDEAYQEAAEEAIEHTMEYLEDNFGDYEVIDAFSGGIMNVLSEAISEGGVRAENLKQRISGLYIADYEGAYAGHEITRLIIESLGYDGIIDNTVSTKFKNMAGLYPDTTHYIVFNSEQAKLTSNKNPSDSKDIRYSSKVDSKGNVLTREQIERFKDSKLRDDEGRLRRMYHGTDADFEVFDPVMFGKNTHAKLHGIFLTSDWDYAYYHAGHKVISAYVDITNPIPLDARTVTAEGLIKFEEELAKTTKTGKRLFSDDAKNKSFAENFVERFKTDYKIIETYAKVMDADEQEAFYKALKDTLGFDGYIFERYEGETVAVAFASEQVKDVSNTKPTRSKNIYMSSKVADPVSNALGLNKQLQKQNEKLREDVKRLERKLKLQKTVTKGLVVKDSSLNAITQMVTKGSKVDKSQVKEGLRDLYESILSNQKDNIIDYDSIMSKAYDIANQITSDMRKEHGDENAIAIKRMLRATPIKFTKEQKEEIEALYGKTAEEFFKGRLTVSKDGRYLKDLWKKWAKNYPELFADVSEENMITELDTIYGAVNRASKAVERFQTQNDIMSKAEEIYDAFWKTGTEETLSDKHKAEIAKLKAEHRKAMAEVKQVAMEQASYRKAIAKVRDEYKETVKKREAKAKETKSKRKLISEITELTTDIMKKIARNDKSKVVPEPILKPFLALVESIDFSSKRALGLTKSEKHPELNGKPTQKDIRMSDLLNEISLGINEELSTEGANDYNDPYGFARLGLPENFGIEVQKMSKGVARIERIEANAIAKDLARVEKYADSDEGFTLQLMSAEELQSLYDILNTLKVAITNLNKLIRAKNGLAASGVGEMLVNTSEEIGEVKVDNNISQFMGIYNKVPNLFFKQLGQGGIEMFNMLKDGWDDFTENIQRIKKFIHGEDKSGKDALYSTDEYAKWKNTVHRFNVTDKRGVEREVVMTEAQLMSLYCLSRREQGMSHLMGNGIDIDKIQTQKLVVNGIKPSQIHKFEKVDMKMQEQLVLTGEILEQMLSVVRNDSRMQTVAEKLQEFMSTVCSEWINDVTLAMYGREMAKEKIYFPIHVNSDVIKAEAKDKESTIFGMLNQSWLNPLKPNSKKEIDICDIFDVFKAHVADTAKYNALAIPVLNLLKIWNYQETIDLGDGQSEVKSAKKAIRKIMGDKGNLYIATLIKQINGDAERHAADSWAMKFLRKYKSAAVAFNTLSALKQPLSYVRANYDIDRKYLYKALMLKKPKVEKCFSTIGVAKWKRMGFIDTNLSLGLDRMLSNGETLAEKTLDMSLRLTEKMDEITWGYLYRAVEYEIKDKYPSLSGDEFEEAVKTRMRDILYDTQVFDSTLTRTQLMREKTAWAQTTTAFGAEPALTINMFMDAYSKFEHEARKNGSTKEAYVKAAKKYGKLMLKATYLFTLGNVLESIVSAFFKALRDYEGEDDEFADFWQNFIDRFIDEENPLTKIPYVKDIVPFAKAVIYKILKINKKVYTDQTPMNEEVFKSISNMMGELINGEFSYKDIKEMANAASQLTGLPIANAIREVKTLWNNTMGRAGFPWK